MFSMSHKSNSTASVTVKSQCLLWHWWPSNLGTGTHRSPPACLSSEEQQESFEVWIQGQILEHTRARTSFSSEVGECMPSCILRKGSNVTTQVATNQMYPASVLVTHPNTCQSNENPSERYKYSEFGAVSILFWSADWIAERPSARLAGSNPSSPLSHVTIWIIN